MKNINIDSFSFWLVKEKKRYKRKKEKVECFVT